MVMFICSFTAKVTRAFIVYKNLSKLSNYSLEKDNIFQIIDQIKIKIKLSIPLRFVNGLYFRCSESRDIEPRHRNRGSGPGSS